MIYSQHVYYGVQKATEMNGSEQKSRLFSCVYRSVIGNRIINIGSAVHLSYSAKWDQFSSLQ